MSLQHEILESPAGSLFCLATVADDEDFYDGIYMVYKYCGPKGGAFDHPALIGPKQGPLD